MQKVTGFLHEKRSAEEYRMGNLSITYTTRFHCYRKGNCIMCLITWLMAKDVQQLSRSFLFLINIEDHNFSKENNMSDTNQCSSETHHNASCEMGMHGHHSKCPCGCGSEHPCYMHMWKAAFHEAKKAVMVDILKVKIKNVYGQKMEETADLMLEAMEAKKNGETTLKNKLHDIWEK